MKMKRIMAFSLLLAATAASAEIMDTIAVGGRVSGKDNKDLAGSAQDVEFRLYASETGGTALWARVVPVAVTKDLTFYTDLKDTVGTEIKGAAATRLRDAVDICARTSPSLWLGWTFPQAREAPRVEIVKYPWAFASTKAHTIGKAKCGTVSVKEVDVTNGNGAQRNEIGQLVTGKLVKDKSAKLTMVTRDKETKLAFVLTGGIKGFQRSGATPEPDVKVANDTLYACKCSTTSDGISPISVKIVPCGTAIADDDSTEVDTPFTQTLGALPVKK